MRAAWLIVPSLLILGACGDPLADIERVTDDTFAPGAGVATALPTQAELDSEETVLSGLFRRSAEAEPVVDPAEASDRITSADPAPADVVAAAGAEPATPRKGVLGWLRRGSVENQAKTVALVDGVDTKESRPVSERSPTAGMALREVALGTVLPFGEVARVCNVAKRDLGKQVERSEPRRSGYALYDSAPNSSKPRSFYVTGFSDSCVRQLTASLVVFGTPTFHEQLRYGLPADEYPYSTTDRAYEQVKSRLCNVGRNTPCGARISKLEGSTAFVSVYEHFGENARWADMLLHDGALLATAMKTP
ncbi:MAG: hypothetical protein ABJ263_16255 [Tateyamaria sp.]|uniref:hypothetical protein n=1 Tax=Tateyamaria sp. TaxID=1929288 RepID=UPI00328475D3